MPPQPPSQYIKTTEMTPTAHVAVAPTKNIAVAAQSHGARSHTACVVYPQASRNVPRSDVSAKRASHSGHSHGRFCSWTVRLWRFRLELQRQKGGAWGRRGGWNNENQDKQRRQMLRALALSPSRTHQYSLQQPVAVPEA